MKNDIAATTNRKSTKPKTTISNQEKERRAAAAQLKRAVMAHDPWFAKRNGESVRWAVNDVIRKMLAAGELKVAKGSKRGRVFTLVGEQQ